ncbi:hypothetical protein NDU88_003345 [Pleurodeles waltl]|uniref:Secreted protein n=1 Tax=Pleurodeles waltl TaxID=8319 RepID=A0AAV7W518_PLEWA|nr:hypothetical protein NDU88_003345 [Pleurodeles waltl]
MLQDTRQRVALILPWAAVLPWLGVLMLRTRSYGANSQRALCSDSRRMWELLQSCSGTRRVRTLPWAKSLASPAVVDSSSLDSPQSCRNTGRIAQRLPVPMPIQAGIKEGA